MLLNCVHLFHMTSNTKHWDQTHNLLLTRQIPQHHKHCILQNIIKLCVCIAHITIHLHMSYMYERNVIYDWVQTNNLLLTRQALPLRYLTKAQIVCFGHSAIHPYRPTFMRGNTYWLCIYNCLVLLFIRPHPYNSFLVLLGSKVKMRQGNGCRDVEEVNC